MIYVILFFLVVFIIVTASDKIKETNEKKGSGRAFVSWIFFGGIILLLALMFSGVGAIGVIPIVVCLRICGKML